MFSLWLFASALLAPLASGILPDSTQLTKDDIGTFAALSFGDTSEASDTPSCRAFPGTDAWPSKCEWQHLNKTLQGRLLHPDPPAAVCYEGEDYDEGACEFLLVDAGDSHFYVDHPLSVLTQWPQGSTCLAELDPAGNCTRGGFPEYVVSATRVADVQAAVNFARNKNLRLVIKNTGHDFGGRSVGAGSLSIWTHNLKSFEFYPEYSIGEYTGMAVHYGAGLETWELFNYMAEYNITVPAPGGRTVGANGGWFACGGHGNLASLYGLGSDQALEIHAVTADGQFVVANSEQNEDLFYALRGGGGSTYAVVTSVIMKAYPPIDIVMSMLMITLNTGSTSNSTFRTNDTDQFWDAMSTYYHFITNIVDAGGMDWGHLTPLGDGRYDFNTLITFPDKTGEEVAEILAPLYDDLNEIGIDLEAPSSDMLTPMPYAAEQSEAPAEPLDETRYRSRLFPRKNWEDDNLFAETFAVIREAIEAGYPFHAMSYSPTEEVAGWPGRTSAVNPAWRNAIIHAMLIGPQPPGLTPEEAVQEEEAIQVYMDKWRSVSPGAGSYMNEGDPGEPDWKQAFYGDTYPRLLEIKKETDPWGVFWAATTVGSDEWEVRTAEGYPRSQNGQLCRA